MISGASAVPMLTLISAGRVTMAATTATSITALAGTRLAVSLCHLAEPGIAPSRLKAKVIREADVMHDVEQKNCADAEMNSTSPAQLLPIAWVKMYATPPAPTPALSGLPSVALAIAKTRPSSRM